MSIFMVKIKKYERNLFKFYERFKIFKSYLLQVSPKQILALFDYSTLLEK